VKSAHFANSYRLTVASDVLGEPGGQAALGSQWWARHEVESLIFQRSA